MTSGGCTLNVFSWNINSLRTSKSQLKHLLTKFECDVLCLQETKISRDQLDEETVLLEGFNSYYSFSKTKSGYSGVATICRDCVTPVAAEEGLTGILVPSNAAANEVIGDYGDLTDYTKEELKAIDAEGRVVITKHKIRRDNEDEEFITFINVYCPRAEHGNEERQNYKIKFYKILQERAEAILAGGSHVVILGDINTSHKIIDTCAADPECFSSNKGREWLNDFLLDLSTTKEELLLLNSNGNRFVDTFRYFYPDQKDAYTCWRVSTGARQTNFGSRIDYIFSNVAFVRKYFVTSEILAHVEGSDHCPISAKLKCDPIPSSKCPALCTKYWPEVAGKQQKLHSFFRKVGQVVQPVNTPASAKRSNEEERVAKKIKRGGQNCLTSYFVKKNSLESNNSVEESKNSAEESSGSVLSKVKKTDVSAEWKNVLSGPKPPPVCSGHKEPCVLRTVKKSGPNQGRQFYTCARPEGLPTNRKARCNYFVWKNEL